MLSILLMHSIHVLASVHLPCPICKLAARLFVTVLSRHADLVGITAGPLNTLHRHDPQSGVGLWTLQLESPAVSVHLADGTSLKLHSSDSATADNASSVVVGTLHGSMYALPVAADWLQSSLPAPQTTRPVLEHSSEVMHEMANSEPGTQGHTEGLWPHALPEKRSTEGNLQDLQPPNPQQPVQAQHALQARHHDNRALQPSPKILTELKGTSQKATPERLKGQGQKAAPGSSTALVQLPAQSVDGQEEDWQSPISLHSVVTSTAPQSFLPNLTDASSEAEEQAQMAPATCWIGELAKLLRPA